MNNQEIATHLEVIRLKRLRRAGWLRCDVHQPESVAGHSWGISWLVLNLLPKELNLSQALAYAALHDLPEVRTGDLMPHEVSSIHEKHENEREAMRAICANLSRGSALLSIWEQYERQSDPESKFVRQLDRLDMAIQATAYHQQGERDMMAFVDSAESDINDASLLQIITALRTIIRAEPPNPPSP
jgi:5'-deoxynucleotidase YfbR-like HD superfamily hydrolase